MSNQYVPLRPAEISAPWMTRVLRDAGLLETGEYVDRINIDDPGSESSYAGQVVRLELVYGHAPARAPETTIAKFPAGEPVIRYLFRSLYRAEFRFYRELAGRVPINVPACYAALADRQESRSLLLLEDLTAFATLGDHDAGCSDEQAHLAVSQLARLHASFWNNPALDQFRWLSVYNTASTKNWLIYASAWLPFQRRLRQVTPPKTRWLINNLWRYRAGLTQLASGRPRGLQHGDFRLANLAFTESDVYAFDWQVVRVGLPAFDLAWFMTTSLTVEQRRSRESDLLSAYLSSLLDSGIRDYAMDDLEDDYRLGLLLAIPQIMVIGAFLRFDDQRRQTLALLLERYEALAEDHDLKEYLRGST